MRTYDETDESDVKELARLQPQPWMVPLLALNPEYNSWGPGEDYMSSPGKNGDGWDASAAHSSWADFGPWSLDDLNECVHFHFEINRDSRPCETCSGRGAHPDAQWITESWYKHSSPFTVPDDGERSSKAVLERFGCQFTPSAIGRGTLPPDDVLNRYGKPFLDHCVATMSNGGEWCTALTQDEVDALWEQNRLHFEFKQKPTADQVNTWARNRRGIGHDAINSWICTKVRCERLGVPYSCVDCEGHGYHYTAPAHMTLVLWFLHPRKGCSRGVEVRIEEADVSAALDYLRAAADRNAARFAKAYAACVPALV